MTYIDPIWNKQNSFLTREAEDQRQQRDKDATLEEAAPSKFRKNQPDREATMAKVLECVQASPVPVSAFYVSAKVGLCHNWCSRVLMMLRQTGQVSAQRMGCRLPMIYTSTTTK